MYRNTCVSKDTHLLVLLCILLGHSRYMVSGLGTTFYCDYFGVSCVSLAPQYPQPDPRFTVTCRSWWACRAWLLAALANQRRGILFKKPKQALVKFSCVPRGRSVHGGMHSCVLCCVRYSIGITYMYTGTANNLFKIHPYYTL